MKNINEGSNRPKTQDGNYQKHRGGPQKRRMSKLRRQEDKQEKEENEEDSYIIKQLKDIRHNAPEEFIEEFGSDDINDAMHELKKRSAQSGSPISYILQGVIEDLTPRDDFYPESFDNAVNDILKRELHSEAVPAIVAGVARAATPLIKRAAPFAKAAAKQIGADMVQKAGDAIINKMSEPGENQEVRDKVDVLQDYIDNKYPTLRGADTWVEDGVDTPVKLEYELAISEYSDTYKSYWGSRPRGFRDRLEENQWDDDDFVKATIRLNDEVDEYRERLRLRSPEYRAEKERELKQKHKHDPSDGGTSLRDIFSGFSREENEG
jgi:hypothetical protein